MARYVLGLDVGSNSVGSVWVDRDTGEILTGVSVFPAGVDEADDKRGEPKNAKRRMTRRTRITLARRSERKRALRKCLIEAGLLPQTAAGFKQLLEASDPWELRGKGLDQVLTPHEMGRVLLHLAQRRGALGLKLADPDDDGQQPAEDGKVKAAIQEVEAKIKESGAKTFGQFIAGVRSERVNTIESEDRRRRDKRIGQRVWRDPIRNKAGSYEHCADRRMIRDEFLMLWKAQKKLGGEVAGLLTDDLKQLLDDSSRDSRWRHKGHLFGQRATNWDLGTLGRCVLEPSDRCVPHADMYASRFRVLETVNNLRILEAGKPARALTEEEHNRIVAYLSGPLGEETSKKRKGQPKRTVTVTDLRNFMGSSKEGWGRASKTSRFRFNIESDEDRTINTDWFHREVVCAAIGVEAWDAMPQSLKEGFNKAILRNDPDEEGHAQRLRTGVMAWGGLDEKRADLLVKAWQGRPRPDAKRLNMSRRAARNLLVLMEHAVPDPQAPGGLRWLTPIEARKLIAKNDDFRDATTGKPLDETTRRRYATGAKGATARDRYYMSRHVLKKDGKEALDERTGKPLSEPPPAPLISNPVVRKAIHEVRRHVVEYMLATGRKPDEVCVELAREAKMGKVDADKVLYRNRLRNRIRKEILDEHGLTAVSSTQKRAAVDRVVLCIQQGGVCPLCGEKGLTPEMAARGSDCEIAHIIPRASGGHNGLSNIVLSHTRCNRDMGRQTPREFWASRGGFDAGMRRVEGIYTDVARPKPSEMRRATGPSLWTCYFNRHDDRKKIERFKKEVSDAEVQGFTDRQAAATTYAARQVMAYLSDAVFDGKGLPERSLGSGTPEDARRIFAGNGIWTSRLRREWGLFFDPHGARSHGLSESDERERKEKNRGDHHHHAIDALIVALGVRTPGEKSAQDRWEQRERAGDAAYWDHVKASGAGASYEEWMENYRRQHRLRPPAPFDYPGLSESEAIDRFRAEVKAAIFGEGEPKPICHRPVKRKLIGALHEETLFGPVLDQAGEPTGNYTARKHVLALTPNHLRMPQPETEKEAVARLTEKRIRDKKVSKADARKWARTVVASASFTPAIVEPSPGKSGIVRDRGLRARLRDCLEEQGVDPDGFTANEIKKLVEAKAVTQASGVPIKSVVLLRAMSDPVVIQRRQPEYASGKPVSDPNPSSDRAYVGGNNHHIEIRATERGAWSGEVVTAYQAAQRKLMKLRAFREAKVPKPKYFRDLKQKDAKAWREERARWRPIISGIEAAHPLVDRSDQGEERFMMSLCEGEMLRMKHKVTGEVDFFVVAKIDKPRTVWVVPHWDARAAGERKDSEGKKIPHSKRDQFAVTPSDLKDLAPDGEPHAQKVWVSPLGEVIVLDRD